MRLNIEKSGGILLMIRQRDYSTLYIHTYIHTYIPTYLHTYLHTNIPTYIHTYIHTYIPTYLPTYLHTYIPTYMHTYISLLIHQSRAHRRHIQYEHDLLHATNRGLYPDVYQWINSTSVLHSVDAIS
jgi:hypothetical protein